MDLLLNVPLQDINADLMFVGADGIDAVNGITTFNEGYSISGAMVTAANKVIAVLDSSNLTVAVLIRYCQSKIDIIITDDAVSGWINWHCRRHG